MTSIACSISRTSCLCSPTAVSTHLCSKDVIMSCRKYSRYHLGRDDAKCKTWAFKKINRIEERLYGSLWVPLLWKYLHFIKTFTYKFSQPLQLLFLNSHRSWALKTHGHLVIDLSVGRLDLQIDHPMTTTCLIIKSTEMPKVKEEVSTGLACPTLAVHLPVNNVSSQKSWH